MKRPKLEPPMRIALLYLLFGGLWILLSDRILFLLVSHNAQETTFQTIKGWFFILVSGTLLYILLLAQHVRDRQAASRMAWLASFPERNPNPIIEIDQSGAVLYANPAAGSKFPGLQGMELQHPWLADLEPVLAMFQQGQIREFQREIQVGEAWYMQWVYCVAESARFRIYGADITERKHLEQQTLQMKRLYATLSQVNQAIVRVKDLNELYQSICDVAVEFGGFQLAWVGVLDEKSGEVRPSASNGLVPDEWPFPSLNIQSGPQAEGMIARSIRTSTVITADDIQTDDRLSPLPQGFVQNGFHSAAVVPFRLRDRVVGVLSLFSRERGLFRMMEELRLLEEMGLDISFALEIMEREAEQKKAEKQLRYQVHLLESVNDAVIASDENYILQAWNRGAERIYGWKAEEVLGQKGIDLLQTRFNTADPNEMRQKIAEQGRYMGEATQLRQDGTRIDVEVASMVLRDETGKITGYVSVNRDITERKRAEEALRENEERLRLSLQAANQGLYDLNIQTGEAIVNREYVEMLGYDPETFVETNAAWIERLHPEDSERVARTYTDYVNGVLPEYRVEFRQRTKDGDWKWILSLGKVIEYDAQGKPLRMLGTHTDITEQKAAEEALRASEERFRLLFENHHTVMLLIEPDSGIVRNANQAAAEFYGYSLAELRGLNIDQINLLTPEELHAERMLALAEERNYFNFQHRLCSGEVRSVEVHSAPVKIDGSPLLFSIVHDITERKRVEEERQSRSRQLASLLEASQSLTESLNLPEVLQKIVDKAANVMEMEKTAIYLVQGEHLYLGASHPPAPPELPEQQRRAMLADHPHLAEALTGQIVVLPNVHTEPLNAAEQAVVNVLNLRTVIYVPLATGKDIVGILVLGTSDTPRPFSQDDLDVARALANHAALALANARLYQEASLHLKELKEQIAERKQAQEQFHLVVESAPNAIMLVNSEGRLRLVNQQVENYFGYARGELIGMDVQQLIPDRFRTQHPVHLSAFLSDPHPKPMGTGRDLYGLRKDGTEFPAEIGLTPLESAEEPLVMVTIVDITARKQAEEKLRRHIGYLTGLREVDQAIASSFDLRLSLNILTTRTVPLLKADAAAILLLDPVMNTLEYATGFGFRRNILHAGSIRLDESYAGRVVMERGIVQVPNLKNELHEEIRRSIFKDEDFFAYYGVPLIVKGKVLGVMEIFHRMPVHRDPEWFDFLNSLAGQAAIAIDNARLWEQVQRHARDLELRVAERTAALNRTNAELEHANRAKDEFLANMSHELRTPLNGILGMSESLLEQRRDPLSGYQQHSLQIIESSGRHLLELINDILDLSKIEAGKFDHYPQMVEVDSLCRSSLAFVKSQAARKEISLDYLSEPSLQNIFADPRRLKQILVNLLSNAVKFTPQRGRVTLQVRMEEEQDLVEFTVTDSGIGIAAQDLKRLFQPFVQVDSRLNRQFEGTGLGLALVQKLTDLHGGSVYVESEVGAGSRFTVRIPWGQKLISQNSLPGPISEAERIRQEAASVSPKTSPEGSLVLLAEDNMASVLTIGEYLKSQGYRFIEAHDGLEAIEKAETSDPSIILMDIQMPVLDGLEAIRRLRRDARFAATPIIALTALAMPDDRQHCLEAGANEYMTKPVRLKFLRQTIENLLQAKS